MATPPAAERAQEGTVPWSSQLRAAEQVVTQPRVVLGMHRSGTSALTGMLCRLGAWVGDDEDLLPGDVYNPRGYFERRQTADTLDVLLAELGGSWDNPPLARLDPLHLEPLRPRLRRLLGEAAQGAPEGLVPLIKDPRLTLFAGELASLLGASSRIVLCIRHPLEVARSLFESQHIPIRSGLALWEAYNSIVCCGLAGTPVNVFSLARALADDTYVPTLAETLLGSSPAAHVVDSAAGCELEPALRHQHVEEEGEESRWLSVAQREMWVMLEAASRSLQPTLLKPVELSAAAGDVLGERTRMRSLQAEVAARTAERDEESVRLAATESRLARSATELDSLVARAEGYESDLERLRQTSSAAAAREEALVAEAQAWQHRVLDVKAAREALSATLEVTEADRDFRLFLPEVGVTDSRV